MSKPICHTCNKPTSKAFSPFCSASCAAKYAIERCREWSWCATCKTWDQDAHVHPVAKPAPKPIEAQIISRPYSCACGCGGKDSQHAKTFTRVLRNIRSTEKGRVLRTAWGIERTVSKLAEARFPWGVETVAYSDVGSGWFRIEFGTVPGERIVHK